MRNFKFYSASLLILSVLLIGFSSCKKSCVIEGDNVDEGDIVTEVVLYPAHGYITSDMSGNYHVYDGSALADKFEMSTDNGFSRSPFNFSGYSILAYPMTLNCNFFMQRKVTINDVNNTATYRITVTQCRDADCSEQRYIENFVVVPAIPSNYTILHDVQIIEQ